MLNIPRRPKPKKTRAKGPKVKTGCITCKIRRVKCDETKPTCLRCARFGWTCDGYLEPSPEAGWNRLSNSRRKVSLISRPSPEPSFKLFETDIEGRYYRLFMETTASNLGGYHDLNLWDRIILQASSTTASIRHFIIALAALDLTSTSEAFQPSSGQPIDPESKKEAYWRHHFALQQYSKAIKGMRDDISSTKQDLRTTLIATILLVCFEAYHGSYEAALRQFNSGQMVLDAWEATMNPEVLAVGLSSPAPHIVEYEVLLAFHQLDIQVQAHTYSPSVDAHIRLKDAGVLGFQVMPKTFQHTDESTVFGTIIMRRVLHFMAMAWIHDDDAAAPPDTTFSLFDRVSSCSSPVAFREQEKILQDLLRWHEAFLPIFHESRADPTHHQFLLASCTQMLYLTTYIGIISKLAASELIYDSLTELFLEIVELAKVVMANCPKSSFTSAFRAICPLNLVAMKCRVSAIRHEAIQLLISKPRREGLWDSIIAAKVCLWIVKLEEQDHIGGFVIEGMRIRNVCVRFRPDGQSLYMSCKELNTESNELVLRESTIAL